MTNYLNRKLKNSINMGNSFSKHFFYLHCFHCNLMFREMEAITCSTCHNILVPNKIDISKLYNLSNYKKKISFIETMCMNTKCRIQFGYNYLQQISVSKKIKVTFREPIDISLNKPTINIADWDQNLRIRYLNYIIEFYNNLVSINYTLYEAILGNTLLENIYNNFNVNKIESPPPYDQVFS